MKNISILGVTGSIGTQTLDVLRFHKEKYNLVAISAHKNVELALKVIKEFNIELVCITDKESFDKLSSIIECENINTRIVYGMDGLVEVATHNEVDIVVTSEIGRASCRERV